MQRILIALAGGAIALTLSACSVGMGMGGHGGHGHGGPHARGPMDKYAVSYKPYETTRTVKCPVCSGAGSIQKVYRCYPTHAHTGP
jgi:hypothetical protein